MRPLVFIVLFVVMSGQLFAQDIFKNHTVQFFEVNSATELGIPGCHYETSPDRKRVKSCDTIFNTRWIFKDKTGIVNWAEKPTKLRVDHLAGKLKHNDECKPFKVVKEGKNVYYQYTTAPFTKMLQFSLTHDTLRLLSAEVRKSLGKANVNGYLTVQKYPFSFYEGGFTTGPYGAYEVCYLGDTTLRINSSEIDCIQFYSRHSNVVSCEGCTERVSYIYVEKNSLLPVQVFEEEYFVSGTSKDIIETRLIGVMKDSR